MEDLIQAVHTRQTQDRLEAKDYDGNNYIDIPLCSEPPSSSQNNSDKEIEKNAAVPPTDKPSPTSDNSTSGLGSKISILNPLVLAYALLFFTNWYIRSPLSPYRDTHQAFNPANASTPQPNHEANTARIAPLILFLNILVPTITCAVLDAGQIPSWGFGALAWSLTLLVPESCTAGLPWSWGKQKECGEVCGEILYQGRSRIWSSTRISTFVQLLIAVVYAYLTPARNMVVVLHVMASSLLFKTAAKLLSQPNTTTVVVARMVIPGAFLCQALLLTQLSDEEGVVVFLVMGVGMLGNLVVVFTGDGG